MQLARRQAARGGAGALAAALLFSLAGCGGDEDKTASPEEAAVASPSASASAPSGSSSGSASTEDRYAVRVSAQEVADAIAQIKSLANDAAAAAGSDKDTAKSKYEGIEPVWYKVEGTIKANNQDSYLAFEDAFALLGGAVDADDSAKAKTAAAAIATAADAYLVRFPASGAGGSPEPSASATASPASSASSSSSSSSTE